MGYIMLGYTGWYPAIRLIYLGQNLAFVVLVSICLRRHVMEIYINYFWYFKNGSIICIHHYIFSFCVSNHLHNNKIRRENFIQRGKPTHLLKFQHLYIYHSLSRLSPLTVPADHRRLWHDKIRFLITPRRLRHIISYFSVVFLIETNIHEPICAEIDFII